MQQRDGGWREGRRSRREGKKGMEEEESVRPRGGTGAENCGSHGTYLFIYFNSSESDFPP